MYVVYMYLMYIYWYYQMYSKIYVDQPLFYGSILFKNETSTNFLKCLGWGGRVSRGVRYHI